MEMVEFKVGDVVRRKKEYLAGVDFGDKPVVVVNVEEMGGREQWLALDADPHDDRDDPGWFGPYFDKVSPKEVLDLWLEENGV